MHELKLISLPSMSRGKQVSKKLIKLVNLN